VYFFALQSTLKSRFDPELSLFIRLTLYRLSIWATGATYGAKLQDLTYVVPSTADGRVFCAYATFLFLRSHFSKLDVTTPIEASRLPRKILLVHGALTIVLPYIHTRLRGHALSKAWPDAPSSDRRRKAWVLMTKLETAHAAVALASFVAFLWDGQ
jgi:peroxin-2